MLTIFRPKQLPQISFLSPRQLVQVFLGSFGSFPVPLHTGQTTFPCSSHNVQSMFPPYLLFLFTERGSTDREYQYAPFPQRVQGEILFTNVKVPSFTKSSEGQAFRILDGSVEEVSNNPPKLTFRLLLNYSFTAQKAFSGG